MYGPNYAWITFGEIVPGQIFPSRGKLEVTCTIDELKQAADRYISTVKLDIRQDDIETFSGMVCCKKESLSCISYNIPSVGRLPQTD